MAHRMAVIKGNKNLTVKNERAIRCKSKFYDENLEYRTCFCLIQLTGRLFFSKITVPPKMPNHFKTELDNSLIFCKLHSHYVSVGFSAFLIYRTKLCYAPLKQSSAD